MDLVLNSFHWAWATFEDLWRSGYVIVWLFLLAAYARALLPRGRPLFGQAEFRYGVESPGQVVYSFQ